jgi:hypothetical protein
VSGTVKPEQARDDAGVPPERQCGNCQFSRKPSTSAAQLACLLNPPVVHIMVAYKNALDPNSMSQFPANTRPTVEATDVCSHHKFTDELSDAEMLAEELSEIAKWLREGITTAK